MKPGFPLTLNRYLPGIATIIVLFVFNGSLNGQDYSTFNCEVTVDNNALRNPFTGGFSAPQFSTLDADQDGHTDLFVFDRVGNVPMLFYGNGAGGSEGFRFSRQLEGSWPVMCCWTLVRDFNRDGIGDIFTVPLSGGISGVELHQGYMDQGILKFKQRRMGGEPGDEEIIWFDLGPNTINVTIPFNDKPEIKDIDGDGDLDILTFDLGGSFVNYYKNLQEERGLSKDTMVYELNDLCFGKFKESGFAETIFLSDDPDECASEFKDPDEDNKSGGVHSGSTILAYDNDNDNDMDLLLGDLTNRGLVYLENGGTAEQAFMTSTDTLFPVYDTQVDLSIFLSAFDIDVDQDGRNDLLISPNEISSITNVNNIWYYRNTGIPGARYSLQQTNFLTEETLDFGSFSKPVFTDYNADGLMDIVVGTDGDFGTDGPARLALYLLENRGSASQPEFVLVDDDYLDFRQFSSTSRNPAPAFGDLDGDQDVDLVIGDADGFLYYFENIAGPGTPYSFKPAVYKFMDIDAGQTVSPAIADLNGDGLGDLIIGERNSNLFNDTLGNVNYFENQGSIGNPIFDNDVTELPNTPILGVMDTRLTPSSAEKGLASPAIVTIDDELNIFLGSDKGHIKQYSGVEGNLYNQFDIESEALAGIAEGRSTSVDFYDIDNDKFLEMIIGNKRGGISFFNTELKSSRTAVEEVLSESVNLFPNPTMDKVFLGGDKFYDSYRIYDLMGHLLKSENRSDHILELADLKEGIYLIQLEIEGKFLTRKLVKY